MTYGMGWKTSMGYLINLSVITYHLNSWMGREKKNTKTHKDQTFSKDVIILLGIHK